QMQPTADPAASQLLQRLEAIERRLAAPPSTPDLSPIAARLDAMEARIAQQAAPEPPPVPDLSPIAARLDTMEARIAALAAHESPPVPDLSPIAARLDAMEARIAEHGGTAAGQTELVEQLRAVDTRLAEMAARPQADPSLEARLAAIEARPAHGPGMDAAAVAAIVRSTVDEVVPKQASELLREAISKLPTRDDLQQIAETLRADLDWRLEKAAAEHGWCSLADVQTTVRKSIAEQDPGGGGGSHLGRLEIAMAEFVQQSKEQQERLIAALAQRVVQHTKTLTKRMLVRDPIEPAPGPERRHETEELAPSLSASGEGSSRMAAITSVERDDPPAKRPTEMALDPVPAEMLDASRRQHGDTTLFTKRMESQVAPPAAAATAEAAPRTQDLHDLVTAEVERALAGAAASTMTESPATLPGEGSGVLPMAASGLRPVTSAPPATTAPMTTSPVPADLAVLVAAEVGRQMAMTIPVHLPPSDSDLARAIARALPQALQDESVRTELFATLALEAAGKPGVLGELTGLRRFLKREIQQAMERQGQPAAP
ncbi:MAG: hypothetical protein J0M02_15310, partial [Planctomycetes bacterium]|nr:hypothetical protein [Planctomycetota bacterium]